MPVSITLSEDDLAAFGLLALAMDSLSIKLRKFHVNFSRVSNFLYLLITYLISYFLHVYSLILLFTSDNFFMSVRITISLSASLDLLSQ